MTEGSDKKKISIRLDGKTYGKLERASKKDGLTPTTKAQTIVSERLNSDPFKKVEKKLDSIEGKIDALLANDEEE